MNLTTEEILNLLEEKASLLQKTQTNLKKCPKQRLTYGYIEVRLKSIDEDWQVFKSYHQALVKSLPKGSRTELPYFANDDYNVIEDLYLCMSADLRDMLIQLKVTRPETSTPNQSLEQITFSSIKLPNIQLPTFTGQYEEWPAYNDLFTSLVHNNATLTNVQKLHYLKSSVGGEAEALLRHIKVTDTNYEQAWNILKQRYGSKRLIINSVLKRLFGLRRITAPTAIQIKNLLDTTTECLNSLNNLQVKTESWDPMIIYIIVQRLDVDTHKAWEDLVYNPDSDKLPTWKQLKNFLEAKFRTLELITPTAVTRENKPNNQRTFHISASPTTTKTCNMCNEEHTLCHCKEFTKLSPKERSEFVREKNLCYNCLSPGHLAVRCRLRVSCKVCHKRHHSLLHQMKSGNQSDNLQTHHSQVIEGMEDVSNELDPPVVAISSNMVTKKSTALLATALIPVKDFNGQITILRALIDQGSQANFISERAAQLLKVKRTAARGTITGVGSTQAEVNQVVQLQLLSRYDDKFQLTVNTYVMPTRITTKLPGMSLANLSNKWSQLEDIFLADPSYAKPGRIDLLLGVEVYAQILKNNLIRCPTGTLCAQETSFGWILFGEIHNYTSDDTIMVMHHQVEFDDLLYKLWEIENDDRNKLTKDEEICQRLYETTVKRNEEGRYIVKLPLRNEPPRSTEGNTKETAMKRLHQLEKRLERHSNLRTEYNKAINEYITLNYMEEVPESEKTNPSVYLPHHAVLKESSETTKTRVVFNASSPDSNHVTLNDDLLVGPQLQEDLRSLIMRWRLKKFGFIADVQKMYLQVLVTKEDADYQRILWRDDPKLPIQDYRLLRLTFGTASAPYLAVRTLHQVAEDEGKEYPEAADTIKRDFFMDDLMSAQDTESKAIETAKQVSAILKKGGFCLKKWASNSAKFSEEFCPNNTNSSVRVNMNAYGTVRTLGLSWNLDKDTLQYITTLPATPKQVTKRCILAEMQHIFDPLGWMTPAVLPAKLILQKLWLNGVTWDETLEPEIKEEWLHIRKDLENLHKIQVSRWLKSSENTLPDATIHGFCDASTKAYGAVAYLRVLREDGMYDVGLIAARSRVAPIKPVSLPRLELCGAVLLSKLLKQISEATRIPLTQIFAWTDSTIVLSWLRGDPGRWKTFVRNRVVTILDNVGHKWFHVKSHDNPADVASRGMPLADLENFALWWQGPEWLKQDKIEMHEVVETPLDLEEKESVNVNLNVKEEEKNETTLLTQFEEFETLNELIKTITYCKRFLKLKKDFDAPGPYPITTEELNEALEDCVRIVQTEEFCKEIDDLKNSKQISNNSNIKNLNPFLDDKNILRVGGRLRHAEISHNSKYPMIMRSNNALAVLVVSDAHKRTLHGGVQLTMAYVRSKFWITRLKSLVSTTIKKCFVCARQRAIAKGQKMGDLPKARVTPARPFFNSGVDFAGPLKILISRGRGHKCTKGYICIFICMATKAIHLELVGDLSTDSFIGAFKRFVARRGRCGHLWSDRGTNFVGASKELQAMWTNTKLEMPTDLINLLAEDGTQWHFIPPYSPNFGGLWEAGVKSVKYHLNRILTATLTFEEMATTLCQIEACLNSRPLCPIDSSDKDDLNVLTPGHFLIGEAPIVIPEPNLQDVTWNRLSRWQHTQKLLQDFWHKWKTEYLSRLQQRPKWLNSKQEFQIGDVVLIKEDTLPPGKWALGRITEKHPGADDLCRVYSLRSHGKIIKRSVNRLCELPIN